MHEKHVTRDIYGPAEYADDYEYFDQKKNGFELIKFSYHVTAIANKDVRKENVCKKQSISDSSHKLTRRKQPMRKA